MDIISLKIIFPVLGPLPVIQGHVAAVPGGEPQPEHLDPRPPLPDRLLLLNGQGQAIPGHHVSHPLFVLLKTKTVSKKFTCHFTIVISCSLFKSYHFELNSMYDVTIEKPGNFYFIICSARLCWWCSILTGDCVWLIIYPRSQLKDKMFNVSSQISSHSLHSHLLQSCRIILSSISFYFNN